MDRPDAIRFLLGLRADREFTGEPVPEAALNDLLEVARWSGSSMNRQPWEFIVVQDRAMLRRLAAVGGHAGHLAGAGAAIVLVMAGDEPVDETYDEGRLAERIMLAAQAHGLGSCIGWFWPQVVGEEVRMMLGVPAGRMVRTAISLGYPDPAARSVKSRRQHARRPLDEMVSRERYGEPWMEADSEPAQ